MRASTLLLTLVVLLAGCLGGAGPTSTGPVGDALRPVIPDDWHEHALPSGQGHDHYDAVSHQNRSTANMELLGWNPLVSSYYGVTAGGHLCGDATDTGQKRLGAVQGAGDVSFILIDFTDARNPEVVGEMNMPFAGTRDVAITPDGKYVLLGTTGVKQPERGIPPPIDQGLTWNSPCNEGPIPVTIKDAAAVETIPWGSGVVLVNIANPKNPVVESYFPLPALGAHSIYATQVGDNYFVLASVVNLVAAISYFQLFDVVVTPAGPKLVHLSYILEQPQQGNVPVINGHNDGVIMRHPITGRTLAWLAHWHQGLIIVDLSNPRAPQIIGRWSDNPGPNANLASNDHGDIHEALPIDTTWNGKHYTFIGQEILGHPTQRPSGFVKAIDTTDPTRPKEAGIWSLPAEVEWGASLQFSPHYITRHNHTVFVSHYHAGVWAIDTTNLENDTKMPSVGVFVPANVSPKPGPRRGYSWTPTIMDTIAMPNGDVLTYDSSSGAYVFHYDDTNPAPPKVWDPKAS